LIQYVAIYVAIYVVIYVVISKGHLPVGWFQTAHSETIYITTLS